MSPALSARTGLPTPRACAKRSTSRRRCSTVSASSPEGGEGISAHCFGCGFIGRQSPSPSAGHSHSASSRSWKPCPQLVRHSCSCAGGLSFASNHGVRVTGTSGIGGSFRGSELALQPLDAPLYRLHGFEQRG